MTQSTTAAAERTDIYFTNNNFTDFEIITKCGRKAPARSLSECVQWLTDQHHQETRVTNTYFVVFGLISYELPRPV
jgi:hypothetical protein